MQSLCGPYVNDYTIRFIRFYSSVRRYLVYSDADSAFQFARIRVAASGDRSVIDAEDHAVHPSQRHVYLHSGRNAVC